MEEDTSASAPVAPAAPPAHTIPFELRGGHVLLSGTVDGHPATFILDSGASMCALDSGWSALLATAGSPSTATGGSGAVSMVLARMQSLRLGSLLLRDEAVALMPLAAVGEQHGRRIDGTIGYSLFARFVVEIDYAARVLRLHEPAAYQYAGSGASLPVDLAMRIPIARVTVKLHGSAPIDARLVLDIGAATLGAAFTAPFVDAHEDGLARAPQSAATSRGVGNAGTGTVTRLDWIDMAGLRAPEPVVMLMREHAGFFGVTWADGTIGAAIFERTTAIFDFARQRVILEPGPMFQAPFAFDASGLALSSAPASADSVIVRSVAPGSVAEHAGLCAGDVITSICGVRATGESLEELRALLRTADVVREVVARRGDAEMRFPVTLRERI
ncbi:MAG TPA: aspartyl protease family protein [Gemmatimonadaceae bacterium]|nr:aspartyl protease family protein [Gemmatimonadaceae bacterium]